MHRPPRLGHRAGASRSGADDDIHGLGHRQVRMVEPDGVRQTSAGRDQGPPGRGPGQSTQSHELNNIENELIAYHIHPANSDLPIGRSTQ